MSRKTVVEVDGSKCTECSRCKTLKNLSDFGKSSDTRIGLTSACLECLRTQDRKIRKNHPERRRGIERKYRFGISNETFLVLLTKQKHKCASCGRAFKNTKDQAVDHCHRTGVIRGILCMKCNLSEGLMGSPVNVLKLYQYMIKNELFYGN